MLSGLRSAHARPGLHVMTVKPGFVPTGMPEGMQLPGPLTAKPEQVAAAVLAASRKQRGTPCVIRKAASKSAPRYAASNERFAGQLGGPGETFGHQQRCECSAIARDRDEVKCARSTEMQLFAPAESCESQTVRKSSNKILGMTNPGTREPNSSQAALASPDTVMSIVRPSTTPVK